LYRCAVLKQVEG